MTTLADHIDAARRAALAPEQPLLLMLAQRKASRRVLQSAADSYREAAGHVDAALASLPPAGDRP